MKDLRELSEDELLQHARDWRRQALHGVRHARGQAHVYEAEFRRRMGSPVTVSDSLDTRPLALRSRPQPWWKFW